MSNTTQEPVVSHGWFARIGRLLASPWMAPIAVALALLLTFCVVGNGLDLDDYFHRALLTDTPRFSENSRGPQAMFRFLPGDPEDARRSMDIGFLPWWTFPKIKAEFFQLITTQTHILDYWLWPDRPDLMHAHSLLWFALLVFLVAKFYRRILGPTWMAGLAVLLFAVEDGHGSPVGWVCNRNILIAASFGVGCLIAHDVWRRDGRRWAFWVALLLWACSLLSKEAGIATCAYLFAYALWLDESTLWRRFLTLVPYGIVLVIWRTVRDSLGYGVEYLGFYVDPITEPSRFAMSLLERYPVMIWGQWIGFSDAAILFRKLIGSPIWWIAVASVCFLGVLFWPLLRHDRISRYFATGMLLAVIPICATFPCDRLLMFVGLGAFGLLVRFWYQVFAAEAPRPRSVVWRVVAMPVALLFVVIHLVIAPVLLPFRATAPTGPKAITDRFYVRLAFDEAIESQDLVIVNPPSAMHANYSLLLYDYEGTPIPRAIRSLAPGFGPVTVRRTDETTIEVEPSRGYMSFFLDRLFRNETTPMEVGQVVEIARMTATVLSLTEDGRPANVAFRFETPLEDESLRWICWKDGEFVPWTPPAVGEEQVLHFGALRIGL